MPKFKCAQSKRPKASIGPERLLDVAESLFGAHGIDAVSLRRVSAEAGLANNFSVQYHFGDRKGLMRAIYLRRLPAIDARRRELLDASRGRGIELDAAVLLGCLGRPFLELSMNEGRHFVSFLARVIRTPIYRLERWKLEGITPAANEIVTLLRQALPYLSEQAFDFRMIVALPIILDALTQPQQFGDTTIYCGSSLQSIFEEALAVAVGALSSPSSQWNKTG